MQVNALTHSLTSHHIKRYLLAPVPTAPICEPSRASWRLRVCCAAVLPVRSRDASAPGCRGPTESCGRPAGNLCSPLKRSINWPGMIFQEIVIATPYSMHSPCTLNALKHPMFLWRFKENPRKTIILWALCMVCCMVLACRDGGQFHTAGPALSRLPVGWRHQDRALHENLHLKQGGPRAKTSAQHCPGRHRILQGLLF